MAQNPPEFPKQYKDGETLDESELDAWRTASEDSISEVQLNLTQIIKDCFSLGYSLDNDGNANQSASLQDQINLLSSGGTPITGTTSDSFTVNSDGFGATLSTASLTTSKTFTFPNISVDDVFVTLAATQTLTSKTLTSPVLGGSVTGTYTLAGTPTISSAISTGSAAFRSSTTGLEYAKFTSTDASATIADFTIYRNSASPAVNDSLARINFSGNNDSIAEVTYAYITPRSTVITAAGEYGELSFGVRSSGNLANVFTIDANGLALNTSRDLILAATSKVRLDGSTTGNAYFYEQSSNDVRVHVSSSDGFRVTASLVEIMGNRDLIIPATYKFYLDGGTNDYWTNSSNGVNELYSAGTLTLKTTSSGGLVFATSYLTVQEYTGTANWEFSGGFFYGNGQSSANNYTHIASDPNTSGPGVANILCGVNSDGDLIRFDAQGSREGAISVSGTTVTYGTFTGGHWTQLNGENILIERGTILSSIDEMCEWNKDIFIETVTKEQLEEFINLYGNGYILEKNENIDGSFTVKKRMLLAKGETARGMIEPEDNETLTKCKISDSENDKNVYGVFSSYDSNGDIMTHSLGVGIIRVVGPIENGDLITSSSIPGVGMKQADDVIRSYTVAKARQSWAGVGESTIACTLLCG